MASEIDLDAVKAAAERYAAYSSAIIHSVHEETGDEMIQYPKSYPELYNDEELLADFAVAMLSEEAQHAEPISESWLREVGFVQTAEPPGDFWFKGKLTLSPAPSWNPGIGWAVIVSPLHFNRIHRRSQLMDWCRVLGIKVKGGSRE